VDLLAARWRAQGRGLSQDFGCSPGGRWLAAHAEEHGFVLPYPLHPDLRAAGSACEPRASGIDPRTGYSYEPWHLRYVGAELVREFSLARAQSAARHRGELALDQWLRHRAGRPDDGDLPVCDGCACGACSTLEGDASRASAPCARDEMLSVRADGSPTPTPTPPALVSARATRQRDDTVLVTATVRIADGTVTQTPAAPRNELRFASAIGASSRASEGLVREGTRDLPGAYRLAIEPIVSESATAERWPFRVGLASGLAAAAFNSAALYLPARAGVRLFGFVLSTRAERVRVALLRDGAAIASSAVTELRVE
jgi:D-alanyl-D-alanine carboxypeptidase